MKKYLTVFTVDWQNQFIYRFNFILWRVRNILRLLMTYFLWRGIYITNQNVFGYSREQMLTYVFLVLAIQTLVLSAPSADNIGGEIGSGDLSNYLVKPVSYLKYWFTRDLSSKLLNVVFAAFEVSVLWFLLRPQIQFPTSIITWLGFFLCCFLAVFLYYFVNVSTRFVAFWTPENTWGLSFVVLVALEILAGGIFPLDIMPASARFIVQLTPFPYLLYYPIAVFLGKITGPGLYRILLQSLFWVIITYGLSKYLWGKGLKVYASEGR